MGPLTKDESVTGVRPRGERRAAASSRVPLTVIGTLLIVATEFLFLNAIYHRADPVRHQRVIAASLTGQLSQTVGSSAVANAIAGANQLSRAGVSSGRLSAIRSTAAALSAAPTNPARLVAVQHAVDAVNRALQNREKTLDWQAEISYVGLLLCASLGWMVWFRKLISRHRSLERQVTEQQSHAASEERLASLVRNSVDVVTVLEADSTVGFVTPSMQNVLGRRSEEVLGRRFTEVVHPDDAASLIQLLSVSQPGFDQAARLRLVHADGRLLNVEGSLTNLTTNPAVNGLVLTVRDVTARVMLEEQLTHQALHDPLTGLANRRLFADRLSHALLSRPGGQRPLVVLFCDLDDFKNVNDSLGHGVGDLVLAEIGDRARATIRAGDTAARLGGDEFAILMEDTELAEAEIAAQRLLEAICEPMTLDGRTLTVHASIGLASARPGELSSADLLRNSDVAMYLAKYRGKGAVAVYETRLHEEALDKIELRYDLERALREDELILHFQPTIDLDNEAVVGFEALVRWHHPDRGLMAPGLFIPIAEESGLIVPLGSWVLRAACQAAAAMQESGRAPKMSVNVAADQLARPEFGDEVLAALNDSGLRPDRLVLEITEGVVLKDLETVIDRLTALRALGVRIAIDDFGTGYSSLAYLRRLPVDILKVDKSFVDRVTTDVQDAALTQAIIAMSHSMNLDTVAEGVESPEQAEWLARARCTFGQGYLWSRPVPYGQAYELLTDPNRPRKSNGELTQLNAS
jgi:diguanylate cyclase (GGDEF)-like protein/PAS domain S-box-containing protein